MRLDATDGLVRAGRADEAHEGAVGRELRWPPWRRPRACTGRPLRQLDVVALERAAQVVDGDLDALLGVLTEGRVGPRQDAPVARCGPARRPGSSTVPSGSSTGPASLGAARRLARWRPCRRSRCAAVAARRERQDADGRERAQLVQFHPVLLQRITGRHPSGAGSVTVTRVESPDAAVLPCVSCLPSEGDEHGLGWCVTGGVARSRDGRRADGRRSDAVS